MQEVAFEGEMYPMMNLCTYSFRNNLKIFFLTFSGGISSIYPDTPFYTGSSMTLAIRTRNIPFILCRRTKREIPNSERAFQSLKILESLEGCD